MQAVPVPSPCRKSPPWIMKSLIWCVGQKYPGQQIFGGGGYYHAVELAALVALRSPLGILGFAGAELAEVLGRLGHDIGIQEDLDAAEWLT